MTDEARRVVLITGAGGGQGRAAALLFAARGDVVAGCDINGEACAETGRMVRASGGEMHEWGAVDLADFDQAGTWVSRAAAELGRIDILYNNGSAARFVPFAEMSCEDWHFTMRNEADLIFYTTRHAWQHLAVRGGCIINTASVSGHAASRGAPQAAHAAAKGAVLALTRQLALEGASQGIRAVSISPGVIETPGNAAFLADPDIRSRIMSDSILQRPGRSEEVAALAYYLASPEAAFITGADYLIDGGRMAL